MRRPRSLPERRVRVRAAPALCYQVVSSAGRILERRSPTERVVEFDAVAGGKRVVTKELVRLDEPGRRISYEWLEGPLPFVQESIDVEALPDGSAELRYRGRYATKRGPIQCLLGMLFVRRVFDRAVREHLAQAKQIAERRAARSKLFPLPQE